MILDICFSWVQNTVNNHSDIVQSNGKGKIKYLSILLLLICEKNSKLLF